jgi:hypothetical protein
MPTYATQSDIEDIFSPANVAAWSLFETGTPTGPADPTRIAAALLQGDTQINAFFTNGPYAVPLVCILCKPILTRWSAVIAGVWLYGTRFPTNTTDYAANRYSVLEQSVYQDMDLYKSGIKRLDAVYKFPHPTSPAA